MVSLDIQIMFTHIPAYAETTTDVERQMFIIVIQIFVAKARQDLFSGLGHVWPLLSTHQSLTKLLIRWHFRNIFKSHWLGGADKTFIQKFTLIQIESRVDNRDVAI